jgi:DNA polymerase-1
VHDELVIEAPESEVENVMQAVKSEMEHAAHLSVPLTVDAKSGANWGEAH